MYSAQIKEWFRGFNFTLFFLTLLILTLGLINLYSATSGNTYFYKQLIIISAGIVLCLIIAFLGNPKLLERYSYHFFAIIIIALVLVLITGHAAGGSRRWLQINMWRIQPSELGKLAIAMAIAKFISRDKNIFPYTLRSLVRPAFLSILLFSLIVMQPDLGTAGIIALISISQLAFTKISFKSILTFFLLVGILLPFGWFFGLKGYQKSRIISFASPLKDPKGSGYHSIQSIIAIGSGQTWGKGLGKGTQTHLQFLPERHTDFIFSVLAEEHGFVGGFIACILLLFFLVTCVSVAFQCKGLYPFYLTLGISAMFFWHITINLAMVLGLFPVVGVTLPFFSYGGSSMLTFLIGIGLILNVNKRITY